MTNRKEFGAAQLILNYFLLLALMTVISVKTNAITINFTTEKNHELSVYLELLLSPTPAFHRTGDYQLRNMVA